MTEKLNQEKERAVVRSIETIIDESRHRPGEDLNKIASDVFATQNFTPELVKRACEAYNKSKSVYMLSKLSSDSRANDFPLIDPSKVVERLYFPKEAQAQMLIPGMDFSTKVDFDRVMTQGISKEAGEKEAQEAPPAGDRSWSQDRALRKSELRLNKTLENMESTCEIHKLASMDAMHKAIETMEKMTTKQLTKTAHIIVNKYGDDGIRFLKIAGATLDKQLPLEKTASAVVLPLEDPYTSIDTMINEAREHVQLRNLLAKTAAGIDKEAAGLFNAGTNLVFGGAEGVLRGAGKTLDPMIEFAKTPIYSEMIKEHKSPKYEEVMDPVLTNQLKQVESTQTFVDVASDDFVKDYPIQDITEAYNNTVSVMPELQSPKYKPWLTALVKQQLVQGNVFDQETINHYMTMKSGLARAGKETSEAKRNLMESLKKEPTAGLPESVAGSLMFNQNPSGESVMPEGGKGGGGSRDTALEQDKLNYQKSRDYRESKYRDEQDKKRDQLAKDQMAARMKPTRSERWGIDKAGKPYMMGYEERNLPIPW